MTIADEVKDKVCENVKSKSLIALPVLAPLTKRY